MGEMGDTFRAMKAYKRRLRAMYGVECPSCKVLYPKTSPSILLPGQKCNVDGYIDLRPRLTREQRKQAQQ